MRGGHFLGMVFRRVRWAVEVFLANDLSGRAQQIAYNVVVTLAPLLIFLTAFCGMVARLLNEPAVNPVQPIIDWLDEQLPPEAADFLREGFDRLKLDVPPLLMRAKDGAFFGAVDGGWTQLGFDGTYAPLPATPGQITVESLHARGAAVAKSKDANLLDLGDGVLLLQATSKMNTMGAGVLAMLRTGLARVADGRYVGLVIGNDDPRAYSAGADLGAVVAQVQGGDWKGLDEMVRYFQEGAMMLRRAPFPVVAAPHGLTLGGGAEYALHADRIQAHAELYMGLVEAGVGLIPAGGGTKELLFRFTEQLAPYDEADPF